MVNFWVTPQFLHRSVRSLRVNLGTPRETLHLWGSYMAWLLYCLSKKTIPPTWYNNLLLLIGRCYAALSLAKVPSNQFPACNSALLHLVFEVELLTFGWTVYIAERFGNSECMTIHPFGLRATKQHPQSLAMSLYGLNALLRDYHDNTWGCHSP